MKKRIHVYFLMYGVEKGYVTIKKIFDSVGVKENCRLVKTLKKYWWGADTVWSAICDEAKNGLGKCYLKLFY